MKKQASILLIISGLLFTASCKKDFEEINKDPNRFTTASDGSLFNAAISSLQTGWNEQLYLNNEILCMQTEIAARTQAKWTNFSLGTEEIWSNYYRTLANLRELEKRFSEKENSPALNNMKALEKIILAYKTFKVTDLFGDIPFFSAGYGFHESNALHPVFDSQESIYTFLMNDLQWASENISLTASDEEPFASFKRFDKLFFGDLKKWQKFSNSLRLRYAVRMYNKKPSFAGPVIKDIIENHRPAFGVDENGFLADDPFNESAALWPNRLGYQFESKGWSFNQGGNLRMGTTMWKEMTTNDVIFDPRVYYFFDTNNNGQWKAYPNAPASPVAPDGGVPYDYGRDFNYSYKGNDCEYSPVNYYLVRDLTNVPDLLFSGTEVLFIRAEAYLRGMGVAKDASQAGTEFLNAVLFSYDFWTFVMTNSTLPIGTTFSANITVPSNLNFLSLQNGIDYFSGSEADQLKNIYSQSWIDFIRQPQEAFALARRTNMTPREGAPLDFYRFTVPPSEVAYNQANWLTTIGSSGDNNNVKVWWMD